MVLLTNLCCQLLCLRLLLMGSVLCDAERANYYEAYTKSLQTTASNGDGVPSEKKLISDFKDNAEGYWCPILGNDALFGCGLKQDGCKCQFEPMFKCWHPSRAEIEERSKKNDVYIEEWRAAALGVCFPTWWATTIIIAVPILILCCCVAICRCMCNSK